MSDIDEILVERVPQRAEKPPVPDAPVQVIPGVFFDFGKLPPSTLIDEGGLATLLGRHRHSIHRAVERGELPPPARLMGKPTWTAGAIVRFHEQRMAELLK